MSQKYCPKCETEKDITEFGPHKNRKDGLQPYCKECRSKYMRTWYEENAELQKSRVKPSIQKMRAERRLQITTYLRNHPCVDCGNDDIEVLEFDHRDPTAKVFCIGEVFRVTTNWDRILIEIEKCDVRCANCHRKKTRRQLGWWIDEDGGDELLAV